MSQPLLHVDLQAGFGKHQVLHHVSFDIEAGDRLGFVGTSGAGKSTLALSILGLLPWRRGWVKGEVMLDGKNLLALKESAARKLRGKTIALVPQSPLTALNSALTLKRHFEQAWRAHEDPSRTKLERRIEELMLKVRLPEDAKFLARKPTEISVGQAQRITLALALLHRPSILIADEPTSALDPATQIEILELLREINRNEGTALLYISHDLLSVLQLCDRLALLDQGEIVECVSTCAIEKEAKHPATLALLRTLPAPAHVLMNYTRWNAL